MEIKEPFVFQADSQIVNQAYHDLPNYLISYNEKVSKEYCAIYFSSNNIYYPNSEEVFRDSILKKNKFEWFGTKINYAHKHIFLRDIIKQWYMTGINSEVSNPDKLVEFLREETKGYKTIFVGSSAGGFISVVIGQQLGADKIFSFNGQFENLTLLKKSTVQTLDPIIWRSKDDSELLPFYDTRNFIKNPKSIYYFHSSKSQWDIEQADHVRDFDINKISFTTSNHGIPFLKSNLPVVLNFSHEKLQLLSGKTFHPLIFSLKTVGFKKTLEGLKPIFTYGFNKVSSVFKGKS